MTMPLQEADIASLCVRFRTRAKKFMREADALAGARDLVRLSTTASTLEWAAGDLASAAGIPLPDIDPNAGNLETSPSSKVVQLKGPLSVAVSTIDVARIHRAHVEPCQNNYYPQRMAYVEAMDEDSARRRVAEVVAALELIRIEDARERVSDCRRATDLIKEGVSEDRLLRLFEVARDGDRVTAFVSEPLFLVRRPAALILKWASIPREYVVAQQVDRPT
jgi:hypothetical protein